MASTNNKILFFSEKKSRQDAKTYFRAYFKCCSGLNYPLDLQLCTCRLFHIKSQKKSCFFMNQTDFGRKNDPQRFPLNPIVSVNNKKVFIWGIYKGILIKAEHVFVFEPTNDGRETHLIHYETMTGMLSPFLMTNKVKANMAERYNIMNHDLKNFCEKKINNNKK